MGHVGERQKRRRSNRVRGRRATRPPDVRSGIGQTRGGEPIGQCLQGGELTVNIVMRKLCCLLIGCIARKGAVRILMEWGKIERDHAVASYDSTWKVF